MAHALVLVNAHAPLVGLAHLVQQVHSYNTTVKIYYLTINFQI